LAFESVSLLKAPPDSTRHQLTLILSLASLLIYLFGLLFTHNFVLIFILTILLLAVDFYYLKNIAGRRLVGLRWWNEVNPQTGESHWVFESSDPSTKTINATDSRFFWIALYSQPLLWVGLAFVAIFSFEFIWLTLVGKLASCEFNFVFRESD
jgi:energy-coupling factor transporter transmembrane protein EcfT